MCNNTCIFIVHYKIIVGSRKYRQYKSYIRLEKLAVRHQRARSRIMDQEKLQQAVELLMSITSSLQPSSQSLPPPPHFRHRDEV